MTNYTYDVFGNLLNATLPGGTALAYVVDGQSRRVGKQVNGALTAGFLYQDQLNIVTQLDGSGNVVSRFVFGSKPNVPDYFTSAAGTFRILSDHLGSPRLIVNTANGSVVEEIDYDEFGNVTNDTAPAAIPFGFAGGLYDAQTGLVRFGARDYDPSVGRWTSKDPLRFSGSDLNFFVYAKNDPVNMLDPSGLDPLQDLCELLGGWFCAPPAPPGCIGPYCGSNVVPPMPAPPEPPPPPVPGMCYETKPKKPGKCSCICFNIAVYPNGKTVKQTRPFGDTTSAQCAVNCAGYDDWECN